MIHLPPYLVVALAASSQHSARVAFGPTMGLPRRCGPPIGLTPPPAAVDALASDVDGMDEMALKLVEASDDASKFRPTRGADGRLEPVLTLPGDTLETTPFMGYVTAASTILTLMVVVRLCDVHLCAVADTGRRDGGVSGRALQRLLPLGDR